TYAVYGKKSIYMLLNGKPAFTSDGSKLYTGVQIHDGLKGGLFILDLATSIKVDTREKKLNDFRLFTNYPNPFNSNTFISYQLPVSVKVTLKIYNLLGDVVSTLVDEIQTAGEYRVVWDGRDSEGHLVASGLYFYQLTAGDFKQTRKLLYIR
ncbi:MAG: T9SS C-terminal target domain-containing protein, partial [Calditrichaeota bacterium]